MCKDFSHLDTIKNGVLIKRICTKCGKDLEPYYYKTNKKRHYNKERVCEYCCGRIKNPGIYTKNANLDIFDCNNKLTERICVKCSIKKDVSEYKDRKECKYGKSRACRDCESDSINKGIIRQARKLRNNGYVKCSKCKEVKSIDNYRKRGELTTTWCNDCCAKYDYERDKINRNELKDKYIKSLLKNSIDINKVTPNMIEIKRGIIRLKRAEKQLNQFINYKS